MSVVRCAKCDSPEVYGCVEDDCPERQYMPGAIDEEQDVAAEVAQQILDGVLRHSVVRDRIAVVLAAERAKGAATELRRIYDEHRCGSGDMPDVSILRDRADALCEAEDPPS